MPAGRPSLLINRRFARLWVGGSVSGLGDIIFATTLALWIVTDLAHGRSWAPLAVSGVLLAAALPDVLVGPLAGVFVDRWDRRRTMLGMDMARAALIAALAIPSGIVALPGVGRPSTALTLGSIYAAIFLANVCGQFFGPARMAAVGDLVPEAERSKASGLTQASGSMAIIIGPPLATALYFAVGAGPALALNALSFLASALAIRPLKLPMPADGAGTMTQTGFRREMMEGLRFFAGSRILTALLVTVVVATLGAGALNALDIFFLIQNLHAPVQLFGVLSTAAGAGVLVGAILAGLFARRLGEARTFWLAVLAVGALLLIYARLTSFAPAVGLLFTVGVMEAALNVVVGPLVLNATPRALIGRVVAVLQPAISLASLLSMVVAGYLASTVLHGFHGSWLGVRWGTIDTIFAAAGLLVIASGIYAALRLRDGAVAPAGAARPDTPAA
jgi:MFS family permease